MDEIIRAPLDKDAQKEISFGRRSGGSQLCRATRNGRIHSHRLQQIKRVQYAPPASLVLLPSSRLAPRGRNRTAEHRLADPPVAEMTSAVWKEACAKAENPRPISVDATMLVARSIVFRVESSHKHRGDLLSISVRPFRVPAAVSDHNSPIQGRRGALRFEISRQGPANNFREKTSRITAR
jgi:hypothetical protein